MKCSRLFGSVVYTGQLMVFWISQRVSSRPVAFNYRERTMRTWRLTTKGLGSCLVLVLLVGVACMILEARTENHNEIGSPIFQYLQSVYDSSQKNNLLDTKLTALNKSVQLLLQSRFLNPLLVLNVSGEIPVDLLCDTYTKEGYANRTVIPGVWKEYLMYDPDDITLVTQLSVDRLPLINRSLVHWTGPFSIAVYVDEAQAETLLDTFKKTPLILTRDDIDVHLVLKSGTFYPVNFLRNMALNQSHTNHVYLTDADLIPKQGLHDLMKERLRAGVLGPQQALVVPAFETNNGSLPYPQNKTELMTAWGQRQLIPFFFDRWNKSHGPTDYERWKISSQNYPIKYEECYEPYVVMRRADVPSYNQRFIGWFRDKISHLLEIHMRNFTYVILHDVYTIHYPHETASDGGIRNQYFECAINLYNEHLNSLREKFPGRL